MKVRRPVCHRCAAGGGHSLMRTTSRTEPDCSSSFSTLCIPQAFVENYPQFRAMSGTVSKVGLAW
jgi:hypothetical protein